MINLVKLYHWKTKSYAKHQATDELFEKLNKHTDQFVEVLIGKDEKRIKKMNKCINVLQAENDKEFKSKVYKFREFLTNMNDYFHAKKDSDLLSIRDEILADINQFLYLMTFDK
jgi:DNA-binding ferritin-like protein